MDKYVLFTSHSPAVMQSMDLDRIFYINRFDECKENENQIISINNEYELNEKLIELYDMFIDNLATAKIMNDYSLKSIYKFSKECECESVALGNENAKESEPQTVTLRTLIQDTALKRKISIFDVGCGKGRTYPMFKGLDEDALKNIDFYAIDKDERALEEYIEVLDKEELYNKFAVVQKKTEFPQDTYADIILLINVFHELSENLCEVINSCFKASKKGTKIILCEVGELDLGEMNYIMFRDNSLKKLFKRLIDSNNLMISCSNFSSFKGTKLLNVIIHIKSTDNLLITQEDFIAALNENIDIDIKQLNEESCNGKSRAFIVNNLANAVCMRSKIDKDEQ